MPVLLGLSTTVASIVMVGLFRRSALCLCVCIALFRLSCLVVIVVVSFSFCREFEIGFRARLSRAP